MSNFENSLKTINETVIYLFRKEEYEKVTLNINMKAYNLISELLNDDENYGNKLYLFIIDYIEKYTKEIKKDLDKFLFENDNLIINFIIEYKKYNKFIFHIIKLFKLVEKRYVIPNEKSLMNEIAFNSFKKNAFLPIKEKIYKSLTSKLISIRKTKNFNPENINFIHYVYKVLETMNYITPKIIKKEKNYEWEEGKNIKQKEKYILEWNNQFQNKNVEYMRERGKAEFINLNLENYDKKLDEVFLEEDNLINEYIYESLKEEEIKNTKKEYIQNTSFKIINWQQKFNQYLEDKNFEKLHFFDKFFYSDYFKKKIPNEIKKYIEKNISIIKNNSSDTIMSLMKLKDILDQIINESFPNKLPENFSQIIFQNYLKEEYYSNQMVNYIDSLLKRKEENDINIFDKLNFLISCFSNKLSFEIEISRKLSTRLIYNESVSLEKEKEFLNTIKNSIDKESYKKMNLMIEDIEKSPNYLQEYLNNSNYKTDFIFNIKILSLNNFDIPINNCFPIPTSLSDYIDNFRKYYSEKGNSLRWCYKYFTLEIKYLYLSKEYISTSNLIQYYILLNLEKYNKITILQLSEILKFPSSILISEINGLIFNETFNPTFDKNNGIIKGNFDNEIKEDNEIELNLDFNYDSLKFNTILKSIQIKEEEIMDERQKKKQQTHILQCIITKIMKKYNGESIQFEFLVNKVNEEIILFKPQIQDIQENLDKLIEKAIIGKDDKKENYYFYKP